MADAHKELTFTFGDPEPVINGVQDLLQAWYSEPLKYYEPPMSRPGLAKLANANGTHRRCLNYKVQQMSLAYKSGPLSRRDFRRAARDLVTFGDCFLQNRFNGLGNLTRQEHIPAVNMRRGKDDRFFQLQNGLAEPVEFARGEVSMPLQYDCAQSIYGVPDWIGAFNDVLLNSEATLFRRRFYLNGSQMGFILYTNDPNLKDEDEQEIKRKVEEGKGVGNFRSLFVNIPNGGEKAIQLIPVGEIGSKDEFERIKNISKHDIIVGHGMQAALAGMVPENAGGHGNLLDIRLSYREDEVAAHVEPFVELNDQLPARLRFEFDFSI